MKHIHLAAAAALSLVLIAGCKREEPAPEMPAPESVPAEANNGPVASVDHTSPGDAAPGFDAKAFAGTYGGTMPCAGCPGIDAIIAFDAEGGYTLNEVYQDGTDSTFTTKGTWSVDKDGKTVLLDPEDKEERDRSFEITSPTELLAKAVEGDAGAGAQDFILKRR